MISTFNEKVENTYMNAITQQTCIHTCIIISHEYQTLYLRLWPYYSIYMGLPLFSQIRHRPKGQAYPFIRQNVTNPLYVIQQNLNCQLLLYINLQRLQKQQRHNFYTIYLPIFNKSIKKILLKIAVINGNQLYFSQKDHQLVLCLISPSRLLNEY